MAIRTYLRELEAWTETQADRLSDRQAAGQTEVINTFEPLYENV